VHAKQLLSASFFPRHDFRPARALFERTTLYNTSHVLLRNAAILRFENILIRANRRCVAGGAFSVVLALLRTEPNEISMFSRSGAHTCPRRIFNVFFWAGYNFYFCWPISRKTTRPPLPHRGVGNHDYCLKILRAGINRNGLRDSNSNSQKHIYETTIHCFPVRRIKYQVARLYPLIVAIFFSFRSGGSDSSTNVRVGFETDKSARSAAARAFYTCTMYRLYTKYSRPSYRIITTYG